MALLEVKDLRTYFYTQEGTVKSVDGVSYNVEEGETLGLVGESGCGKSVSALSILRLIPQPPGRIVSGEILFQGRDILKLDEDEIRKIRGNDIAMVFQEPMTSLNPVLTIGRQMTEALDPVQWWAGWMTELLRRRPPPVPVFGTDGTQARQLGLNLPPVAEILRRLAFVTSAGAAVVRVPADRTVPAAGGDAFGVLCFVRQTVRPDPRVGHVEVGCSLACYVIAVDREPLLVEGPQKRDLLYALFDATVARAKPDPSDLLVAALGRHETDIGNQLRRPSEPEMRSGVRHAVTPLFAALVLR